MDKGLAKASQLTAWMIWKQCSSCTFEGEQPSARRLVDRIKSSKLKPRSGLELVLPA
jgi:hypothetical protein